MTMMLRLKTYGALAGILSIGLAACNKPPSDPAPTTSTPSDFYTEVVEGLPTDALTRVKAFESELKKAAATGKADQFGNTPFSSVIIRDYYRWEPGSTVTVAFDGGSPALREQIEQMANMWTTADAAKLKFSFRDAQGNFRQWSVTDQTYGADIRISFNRTGNWSHIGTMSREPRVTKANQPSMNLGGFDRKLPSNWKRVVQHEFGHAIGFAHEHQHPAVECGFRFEDDPGYVKTTNGPDGPFIPDSNNRRPGLYTWFSGPPNGWDQPKVDNNLKAISKTSAYPVDDFVTLQFDPQSIMKYHFREEYFIEGNKSKCYTPTQNEVLSAQDRTAAARAYGNGESLAGMIESLDTLSVGGP
jgi:hypothetical protein